MKRMLLSAAGAFALSVVAFASGAQAQCAWTPLGWSCAAAPAYAAPYYYGYPASPYAAWNAYDYRDYRLQPDWLPTYPGPRAGH